MSEGENFLARWSARKLKSRMEPPLGDADAQQPQRENAEALDKTAVAETPNDTPADRSFDPAQLPPLESIGPDTDIAAFLRRDVPPELTRAALRRAWTSDPAIKNFVGLVENGWDFNDPSAMLGFGSISPEEVARLAGKLIAALPEPAPGSEAAQVAKRGKNAELASSSTPEMGSLEAPKTEQPSGDSANDAAQQNETGDKS
jgi:hypothetical protein